MMQTYGLHSTGRRLRIITINAGVVFNLWEGIIVMVQQCAPFLVFRGLSKSHGMIFQRLPVDEEKVTAGFLKALLKLMGDITRHAGNNRLRPGKRAFKFLFLTGFYFQYGHFQYHACFSFFCQVDCFVKSTVLSSRLFTGWRYALSHRLAKLRVKSQHGPASTRNSFASAETSGFSCYGVVVSSES